MGAAKRRKETGAPPPGRPKSKQPLYIGIGVPVLAAEVLGVVFLTAPAGPGAGGTGGRSRMRGYSLLRPGWLVC